MTRIINGFSPQPSVIGTVADIVSVTGLHTMEVAKILRKMTATHDLQVKKEERGLFYYFRK